MISKEEFLRKVKTEVLKQKTKAKFNEGHVFVLLLFVIVLFCVFFPAKLIPSFSFVLSLIFVFFVSRLDKQSSRILQKISMFLSLKRIKFTTNKYKEWEDAQLFESKFDDYTAFCLAECFSRADVDVKIYDGVFEDKDGKKIWGGIILEIKQNYFYEEPIVFTERKRASDSDVSCCDEFFVYSKDTSNVRFLCEHGISKRLLEIKKYKPFIDDCKMVEASFYQNKLFIAVSLENFAIASKIVDYPVSLGCYENFYDEVAAIEKYCQQFKDL